MPVLSATVVAPIVQKALADRLIHAAIGAGNHALGLSDRSPLVLYGTGDVYPPQQPPDDSEQRDYDQESHGVQAMRMTTEA